MSSSRLLAACAAVAFVVPAARAVRVLARLQQSCSDERLQEDERLRDAVDQGKAWLLEQREFPISSDAVDRLVGDQVQFDYTRHFTAAWVIKALVSAGIPATHSTVSNAVGQVWDSYAGDTAAVGRHRQPDDVVVDAHRDIADAAEPRADVFL